MLTASIQALDEMTGTYLMLREIGRTPLQALRQAVRLENAAWHLSAVLAAAVAARLDSATNGSISAALGSLLGLGSQR